MIKIKLILNKNNNSMEKKIIKKIKFKKWKKLKKVLLHQMPNLTMIQ